MYIFSNSVIYKYFKFNKFNLMNLNSSTVIKTNRNSIISFNTIKILNIVHH